MESQRSSVDNAPLLVNLLRLIRDARSPNYQDHEKGPATFHLGGLSMRDTGSYEAAEELWRQQSRCLGAAAPYRGPLYLAVYLNQTPVEVWTLQDFRDPLTDHSVPRDFEQLEELNTLVRVLFAHLRCQEIYSAVLQSCVTTTDDGSRLNFPSTPNGDVASLPHSPMLMDPSWSCARSPHTPANRVALRLFHTAEDCPSIPVYARRHELWSSSDFVRVDVTMNRSWRHHSAMLASMPTTLAAASSSAGASSAGIRGHSDGERLSSPVLESSSPIRMGSPGSRRGGYEGGHRPLPGSLEVMGSLEKASLLTPYLAPAASPGHTSHHSRSPTTTVSPLMSGVRPSTANGMSDLSLPSPAELSNVLERNSSRPLQHSRPPPKGPESLLCGNRHGAGEDCEACAVHAVSVDTVNRLEDAVWLSDAEHVRRMGTLVYSRRKLPSASASPLAGMRAKATPATTLRKPKMNSLVPSTSIAALSGIDLDRHFASSAADLEDLDVDMGPPDTSANAWSNPVTEQLIALLALCSQVKLRSTPPAPLGDLVLALNLRECPRV